MIVGIAVNTFLGADESFSSAEERTKIYCQNLADEEKKKLISFHCYHDSYWEDGKLIRRLNASIELEN